MLVGIRLLACSVGLLLIGIRLLAVVHGGLLLVALIGGLLRVVLQRFILRGAAIGRLLRVCRAGALGHGCIGYASHLRRHQVCVCRVAGGVAVHNGCCHIGGVALATEKKERERGNQYC